MALQCSHMYGNNFKVYHMYATIFTYVIVVFINQTSYNLIEFSLANWESYKYYGTSFYNIIEFDSHLPTH
mgnify:CR=1 FL=1